VFNIIPMSGVVESLEAEIVGLHRDLNQAKKAKRSA
jgi:hypothetical protein